MREKIDIFQLLLKATVTERRLTEGYWLIIASCKNVMASDFQEYDRTIGTPKAVK